ncbi:MAG: rare lipoprotein [Acidobacteriota bacterium]|jgi:rare lipoprotein A
MESSRGPHAEPATTPGASSTPSLLVTAALVLYMSIGGSAQSHGTAGRSPAPEAGAAQRTGPTGTSGVAGQVRTGRASFIADSLDGRTTASGERYDKRSLVAAHPTYPLGTILRVMNTENGRVVEVKVIDRTASAAARRHRMIDLSRAAAERLDFVSRGTARVRTEVLEWGGGRGQ